MAFDEDSGGGGGFSGGGGGQMRPVAGGRNGRQIVFNKYIINDK